MKSRRAFTLMEVLVVISILALLMAILVPALGLARRTANNMRSQTQLRSIQNSFVIYADKNNDWYPGLSANGDRLHYAYRLKLQAEDATAPVYPVAMSDPEQVFWYLLLEVLLPADELISPADDEKQEYSDAYTWDAATGALTATFSSANYSYAVFDINGSQRKRLWRANGNSQMPVVCDRAIDNDALNTGSYGIRSIHTNPVDNEIDWEGFIAWNDGHVNRDNQYVPTRLDEDNPMTTDDLFGHYDDSGAGGEWTPGNDDLGACMDHSVADGPF